MSSAAVLSNTCRGGKPHRPLSSTSTGEGHSPEEPGVHVENKSLEPGGRKPRPGSRPPTLRLLFPRPRRRPGKGGVRDGAGPRDPGPGAPEGDDRFGVGRGVPQVTGKGVHLRRTGVLDVVTPPESGRESRPPVTRSPVEALSTGTVAEGSWVETRRAPGWSLGSGVAGGRPTPVVSTSRPTPVRVVRLKREATLLRTLCHPGGRTHTSPTDTPPGRPT